MEKKCKVLHGAGPTPGRLRSFQALLTVEREVGVTVLALHKGELKPREKHPSEISDPGSACPNPTVT